MPREASKEVSKKIVHWDSEFSVWNRLFFYYEGETEGWKNIWPAPHLRNVTYFAMILRRQNQNILLWHEARLKLVRDKWSETSVVKDTWILYFKLVSDVFFCRPFNNRYKPTLLPSIFITGVHPPSPHPKSPIWQRTEVVFEPKCKVTNSLAFDLFGEPDQF